MGKCVYWYIAEQSICFSELYIQVVTMIATVIVIVIVTVYQYVRNVAKPLPGGRGGRSE